MNKYFLIIAALLVVGCNETNYFSGDKINEVELIVPVDVSATIVTDYSNIKLKLDSDK